MIDIYWDESQKLWAIDLNGVIYTFAFSKEAAEKIVGGLAC